MHAYKANNTDGHFTPARKNSETISTLTLTPRPETTFFLSALETNTRTSVERSHT